MKTAPLIGIARHRLTTDSKGVTTPAAFHGCPLRRKYRLNPVSPHPDGIWERYDCVRLYKEVRIDGLYSLASRGNVTFGDREPLLQNKFIRQFRQLCDTEWRITIEKDGSITDPQAVRSADPSPDKEALEAISRMPAWKPAALRGKPVVVRMSLPIFIRFIDN
jgi:Gram-negative bacterial tonB protein.